VPLGTHAGDRGGDPESSSESSESDAVILVSIQHYWLASVNILQSIYF
jgi:hypothetical protein